MWAETIIKKAEDDMSEFKTYHPVVNFTFFVLTISFSMFFMHPFCIVISFVCGFFYSVMLKGKTAVKTFFYILFMMAVIFVINPLFNHAGVTVVKYLPSGNPLTAEAMIYGLCAALMLAAVIFWFSCYNEIMTSDKFIYLFGKIIPSLSLVISMTLRFVPHFNQQLKEVINAQKCMGKSIEEGSVIKRVKNGVNILSVMITRSLENAVETAQSMKARGYGIKGRSAYSNFKLEKRDKCALVFTLLLGIYTAWGALAGGMYISYFPKIAGVGLTPFSVSVFSSYLLLCIFPIIIEIREARKWKALRSKI